jgi:amino acid transporter
MFSGRRSLLIAFAFCIMADPVSSVAYAIEAALRSLNGDLGLLLLTMTLVIVIIGLVIVNYHQLIARFPDGGGAAAAAGSAFGEPWAFIPIGALIVDFVLTIAISACAGASAIIAYFPSLAAHRIILALALLTFVACLTWFGHLGRAVFAVMTLAFIAICSLVVLGASHKHSIAGATGATKPMHPAFIAVILAFPVAMALATGVEAPASSIAQLGQLDQAGRRRFGRITLWLTLGIVGTLTLGLTIAAVKLRTGIPQQNSTLIANIAKISVGHDLFAAFQFTTMLLLLAAASSSFQAGPGLLKALARSKHADGKTFGILHHHLGAINKYYTPYVSVLLFLLISALVVVADKGSDQKLVLFYAVAVFMSFFVGLVAMARFSWNDKRYASLTLNVVGAAVVGFTLIVNLTRIDPIASIAAALLISFVLYRLWIRAGRPLGISRAIVGK